MGSDKLTPKQKAFCEEYIFDFNATAAYKRAGYSSNREVAMSNSCRLLSNDKVKKYIAKLQEERKERTEINADRVLEELSKIAFSDLTNVLSFNENGVSLKDSEELSSEITGAISKVSFTPSERQPRKNEPIVSNRIYIKLHDKMKALALLAQHLGLTGDFNCAIATLRRYGLIIWQDERGWHILDEQMQHY